MTARSMIKELLLLQALVVRALLLMSTVVRVRGRNSLLQSVAQKPTGGGGGGGGGSGRVGGGGDGRRGGRGGGGGGGRGGGSDEGEEEDHGTGTSRLLREAEALLCRVLSSDPHFGPALMAIGVFRVFV